MNRPSSTPRPGRPQMIDFSTSAVSDVFSPEKSSLSKAVRPTEFKEKKNSEMLDLICEAVREIGAPRKGASYIAIRKWVIDKGQKEKSGPKFPTLFQKAFLKGIEEELLIKKGSNQATGLRGFFGLKKEPKVMTKKAPTPPKVAVKARPQTRVSMAVLIARKKKNMAIMNGSVSLRKSLNVSIKAKAKNRNEPGPSRPRASKASENQRKLPAVKQTKEARGKKRTKAAAREEIVKKAVVPSKRQQKVPKAVENKSDTTKLQGVSKAIPKKQSKADTEAPKRKLKTPPLVETTAPKRKLVKTKPPDEPEAHPENRKNTESRAERLNKRKAPVNTVVPSKKMSTSDDETTTSSKRMKTESNKAEAPPKKQPRSKPPPKKLEAKTSSETEVSSKNTQPLDEPSTSGQTTTITDENEAPTKKQIKTQSKKNLKSKVPAKEMDRTSDEDEAAARIQMTTALSDETEAKGQPKKRASKSPNQFKNKKMPEDAKKPPKAVAGTSNSTKKLPNNETYIEKQPAGETGPAHKNLKEKKPKKDLKKTVLKAKLKKTFRKDVSDSELEVSIRTGPLKSYHSDPETSVFDD